jgi:hypothetical protein
LLQANKGDAEETGPEVVLTSNGFTINSSSSYINESGKTYIYAAFAGSDASNIIDVDVLNNTMTVDGGSWSGADGSGEEGDGRYLPSQSYITAPIFNDNGFGAYTALANAFDGDTETRALPEAGGYWTWTFDNLEAVSSLFIYGDDDGTGTAIEINGQTIADLGVTVADPLNLSGFVTELNTLKIYYSSNNFYHYLNGIELNGKTLIDSSIPSGRGETQVTGQPLVATANDVDYQDGNTLGVSGVSGSWRVGLNAQGAEVTSYAPSPQSIVFTSMNGGTTPFTSTDATLTSRTWTLEKGNSSIGPWTEVGTYLDFAANESQDGATPWNNPDLEPNKFYQVKVKYDSNNADSVESTFNTFKTGDA